LAGSQSSENSALLEVELKLPSGITRKKNPKFIEIGVKVQPSFNQCVLSDGELNWRHRSRRIWLNVFKRTFFAPTSCLVGGSYVWAYCYDAARRRRRLVPTGQRAAMAFRRQCPLPSMTRRCGLGSGVPGCSRLVAALRRSAELAAHRFPFIVLADVVHVDSDAW